MTLHHVEVRVLLNHPELLQEKHKNKTASRSETIACLHIPTRANKKRPHLVDEVHGGREEHHDPARRLPSAHAAGVLPRKHDGDHGLPGPRVEHRDGVPAQRRRENVHLVPARARTSPHISSAVRVREIAAGNAGRSSVEYPRGWSCLWGWRGGGSWGGGGGSSAMGVVGCGSRVRCERSRGCGGEVHGGVSGNRGARINRRRDRGESGAVASGAGGEGEARDLVGGDGEVPGSSWIRRLA
jgi:hypothetical protein